MSKLIHWRTNDDTFTCSYDQMPTWMVLGLDKLVRRRELCQELELNGYDSVRPPRLISFDQTNGIYPRGRPRADTDGRMHQALIIELSSGKLSISTTDCHWAFISAESGLVLRMPELEGRGLDNRPQPVKSARDRMSHYTKDTGQMIYE